MRYVCTRDTVIETCTTREMVRQRIFAATRASKMNKAPTETTRQSICMLPERHQTEIYQRETSIETYVRYSERQS
jgi:hypothetical protein